jgi:hypothetical protein
VVNATLRPLNTPERDPAPIVEEFGWAPEPVWTVAEILIPPGFDPRTVKPLAGKVWIDSLSRDWWWG